VNDMPAMLVGPVSEVTTTHDAEASHIVHANDMVHRQTYPCPTGSSRITAYSEASSMMPPTLDASTAQLDPLRPFSCSLPARVQPAPDPSFPSLCTAGDSRTITPDVAS
jgi:hypothetical protein